PSARLMRTEIILWLVFGSVEIVPNRFQLFESDIDRAVLAAWEKQCGLPLFKIFLDSRPTRCADSKPGTRNMRRDFGLLQRVKLLQLLQTEREDIVVQRLRCTAKQALQRTLVAGGITGVNGYGAAHVAAGGSLDAQMCIADEECKGTSMRSA